jgi:hypothetical protein
MPGSKQKRRKSPGRLSTVYPLAAGIDVGATAHVVAVPPLNAMTGQCAPSRPSAQISTTWRSG